MNFRKSFRRIILIALSTIVMILLIWSIAPSKGKTESLFNPAVNYNAGDSPYSVALGDFDGDENLDIAVGRAGSYSLSILMGNGDGTFQNPQNYQIGEGVGAFAIGDLNKDGNLDIVGVASDIIWVLLGKGDGTFQSEVGYDIPWPGRSVAIGDLNEDGNPDLAVCSANDHSVLFGKGDGTFQSAVVILPTITGFEFHSAANEDLNGDGHLDLIMSGYMEGEGIVRLGNGDGTFQSPIEFSDDRLSYDRLAIDDLNGDGNPDIARPHNFGEDGVAVMLGNGDGTFQSEIPYVTGDSPKSVAIDDLNGDGHLDLAVANTNRWVSTRGDVSVLLGNGDGTFQSAVNYGADDVPCSVAIGDLNGDGHLDLSVANRDSDNVSILINTGGVSKLLYTSVTPCRIVDTRKTSAGMIGASEERDFHVFGDDSTISAQGGNSAGCPVPSGEPLAAHVNMVAVNPTGKGNL